MAFIFELVTTVCVFPWGSVRLSVLCLLRPYCKNLWFAKSATLAALKEKHAANPKLPALLQLVATRFATLAAKNHGIKEEIGLNKIVLPVKNTRNLTKRDMKLNDYAPKTIRIDPQTFDVFIDDELVTCEPIHTTSLSQRYFLF